MPPNFYDEMELDRPFQIFTDLPAMYGSLERLREIATRADTTVVAGHDPAVMDQFFEVADNCLDLNRPSEG